MFKENVRLKLILIGQRLKKSYHENEKKQKQK